MEPQDLKRLSDEMLDDLLTSIEEERKRRKIAKEDDERLAAVDRRGCVITCVTKVYEGLHNIPLDVPISLSCHMHICYKESDENLDKNAKIREYFDEDTDLNDEPFALQFFYKDFSKITEHKYKRTSDWTYSQGDDCMYAKGVANFIIQFKPLPVNIEEGRGFDIEHGEIVLFFKHDEQLQCFRSVSRFPREELKSVSEVREMWNGKEEPYPFSVDDQRWRWCATFDKNGIEKLVPLL